MSPRAEAKSGADPARVTFSPIGVIHTPFDGTARAPRNPADGAGVKGTVEVYEEYRQGLTDLEGFSHILLVFHFDHSGEYRLMVTPPNSDRARGVFATRAPIRPNPIGVSVVRLDRIEGNLLYIEDIDILDGTPLLDIKPYIPNIDEKEAARIGWLTEARNR